MRRNSNLELRLPSSPFDLPSSDSGDNHHHHDQPNHHPNHHMMMESSSGRAQDKEEQQQELTIFYNGRVCVCHVTQLQAISILLLANRSEMEERMKTTTGSEPSSPALQTSHLYGSMDGLSMKRSLQRFLQKRKHRTQATSPYHQ